MALLPSANAAVVVSEYGKTFGEQDPSVLAELLRTKCDQVGKGDLKHCEAMLVGQAHALQSIFMNLSRRALSQDYLGQFETYLRMALKAQSQCRMTLETLAAIKNPPVVYARQANVTTGPQQINNGTAVPRTPEKEIEQTQLSGGPHELLPDTGASGDASRVNPTLETLGKIDRTEVPRG